MLSFDRQVEFIIPTADTDPRCNVGQRQLAKFGLRKSPWSKRLRMITRPYGARVASKAAPFPCASIVSTCRFWTRSLKT